MTNIAGVGRYRSLALTPDEQRKIIGRFQTAPSKPTAEGATLKKAHEEDYMVTTLPRGLSWSNGSWTQMSQISSGRWSRQSVARSKSPIGRSGWRSIQVNALWANDEQQAHIFGGKHHGGWGLPNVKGGEGLFIMFHVHAKFSMMHGLLYFCAIFARLKLQGLELLVQLYCLKDKPKYTTSHPSQTQRNQLNKYSN